MMYYNIIQYNNDIFIYIEIIMIIHSIPRKNIIVLHLYRNIIYVISIDIKNVQIYRILIDMLFISIMYVIILY